jgi:hypothetical protein
VRRTAGCEAVAGDFRWRMRVGAGAVYTAPLIVSRDFHRPAVHVECLTTRPADIDVQMGGPCRSGPD